MVARPCAQVALRCCCPCRLPPPSQQSQQQSPPPPSKRDQPFIVLLLLSARDCAKSLVSRAGTVSRVHVSSQSGGWRTDGSAAGPQPRQAGRQEKREGGREGPRGGRGWMLQQIKQRAGSLSTHVFHLVERTLSAKQGEAGG